MSIFRSTFTKEVQKQLKARQNALSSRNPRAIQQINARNAWIRMTSGVNVATKPKLAEQYILQGGVLLDKKLRSGIGINDGAYNTQTPQGNPYIRGIRPMPGITSIDIKSISAYGSLREVTVNFICHDISQLEDLELLYMRPGYTVLVEWGWLPYLNNEGELVNIIGFYDDVLKGGKDFPTILSELFQRSKQHDGNYDAMYGYVKNYSWTARMDGGYDCQTVIISIGEILESLKVNVTSFNMQDRDNDNGLLFGGTLGSGIFTGTEVFNNPPTLPPANTGIIPPNFLPNLQENYAENTLVGLLYELDQFIKYQFDKQLGDKKVGKVASITHTDLYYNGVTYDLLGLEYATANTSTNATNNTSIKSYITLESFLQLLNNYVVLGTKGANGSYFPIVKLSTKPNKYDVQDLPEGEKESLLCLAHPLQVSVDVDVCLITSPKYAEGFSISITEALADQEQGNTNNRFEKLAEDIYNQLETIGNGDEDPIANDLINGLGYRQSGYNKDKAKKFAEAFYNVAKKNFKKLGSESIFTPKTAFRKINILYTGGSAFSKNNIESVLKDEKEYTLENFKPTIDILFSLSIYEGFEKPQPSTQTQTITTDGITTTTAFKPIDYLKDMQSNSYVKKFEYKEELGKIGNIYLNISNLQQLAKNTDGTSSEKKEIKLYDYLKKVLSQVQESIGNVNNFDIHTDPVDNNPRVIDINYTDTDAAKEEILKNVATIEIANTSGSVRSYNLQSQIFPEQSAMVSISAQVGSGGEQGLQNNTLLDFNRGVTDRIIAKKIDPVSNLADIKNDEAKAEKIKSSVIALQKYITPPTENPSAATQDTDVSNSNKYKAALRDLIVYVQGITDSQSKNRAIIPVKISLTMDGIGGLVIGHLFQFPPKLLPAGYKFDNTEVGAKLLQTVMRLGHKIENNDWTTTIEAYNIVFNNPTGSIKFSDLFKEGTLTLSPSGSAPQTNFSAKNNDAKKAAETYLGRVMSDDEWTQVVSATFAEASGNQTERAYVMGAILNRVRTNFGRYGSTVTAQLNARNQFESVTGNKNDPGPSPNFARGPNQSASDNIYGAALNILPQVPKTIFSFTSANRSLFYNKDGTKIEGRNSAFYDNAVKNWKPIGDSLFG